MRVDNSQHPHHDHGFGLGAREPEAHELGVGIGGPEHVDPSSVHSGGLGELGHLDQVGPEHFGGHVEVGHLDHDFGQHHDGLHGLHDSIGIGFTGDEHHSLHDTLHEQHDPTHDVQHHDVPADHHGLGDLFHHG